jgi:hypothetical protein
MKRDIKILSCLSNINLENVEKKGFLKVIGVINGEDLKNSFREIK